MRAVVPAQITTVEDKLTDFLSVRQFAILMVPAVISIMTVISLPPFSMMSPYKWVIIGVSCLLLVPLVIRLKGKILLDWLVIYLRYISRPRYYVFNKNNSYLRDIGEKEQKEAVVAETTKQRHNPFATEGISEKERLRLQALVEQGDIKLEYRVNKRGQIDVIATEIK